MTKITFSFSPEDISRPSLALNFESPHQTVAIAKDLALPAVPCILYMHVCVCVCMHREMKQSANVPRGKSVCVGVQAQLEHAGMKLFVRCFIV